MNKFRFKKLNKKEIKNNSKMKKLWNKYKKENT